MKPAQIPHPSKYSRFFEGVKLLSNSSDNPRLIHSQLTREQAMNPVREFDTEPDVDIPEWTKEQEVHLRPKEFIFREIDDENN